MKANDSGQLKKQCKANEVGEICLLSPGVQKSSVYTQEDKNKNLYAEKKYMRTGDLGHLDDDGYLWISGRAKDIIIRGGHNIDPVIIEVKSISKIGKRLIDNKKSNFLSLKFILNFNFWTNSQVKIKNGINIPICFPIKIKGN